MSDTPALETLSLTKRFRALAVRKHNPGYAVKDLSITVREGDVYGFLGPNGSGKTTTIRMLLGLVRPTAGTARIFGFDVRAERLEAAALCGSMIDVPAFYPYLSARANLALFGGIGGGVEPARVDEVLEMVGLAERADSKVRTFSHGMKQRLGFALAVLRRPRLLLLDEPTNGLDPEGNWLILQAIRRMNREEGVTVLLSSHLLSEVEEICNRTAIVRQGELLYEGDVQSLVSERAVEVGTDDPDRAAGALRAAGLECAPASSDRARLVVRSDDPAGVNELLAAAGVRVNYLAPRKRTLREVFLKYMDGGATAGKEGER